MSAISCDATIKVRFTGQPQGNTQSTYVADATVQKQEGDKVTLKLSNVGVQNSQAFFDGTDNLRSGAQKDVYEGATLVTSARRLVPENPEIKPDGWCNAYVRNDIMGDSGNLQTFYPSASGDSFSEQPPKTSAK